MLCIVEATSGLLKLDLSYQPLIFRAAASQDDDDDSDDEKKRHHHRRHNYDD